VGRNYSVNAASPEGHHAAHETQDGLPSAIDPGSISSVLEICSVGGGAWTKCNALRAGTVRQSNQRLLCDGCDRLRSCSDQVYKSGESSARHPQMVASGGGDARCWVFFWTALVPLHAGVEVGRLSG
jgi:hypothetical protein